jgi:hypothetical protein
MNFAQYLAMTNRTSTVPTDPLRKWERRFLLKDWPDAIADCKCLLMFKALEEFAIKVEISARELKFHDLEMEASMILEDCRTFARGLA